MNYLSINNWKDFFWNYITMGGSSLSRGATLGIRIEIFLLVLASFNYVRTKTGSIFRAILGAISIYTVLVISGSIPKLLGLLVGGLGLQFQSDDRSAMLILLCADLVLLFLAIWRHSPGKMKELLLQIRWAPLLASALLFMAGAKLAVQLYPENFFWNPTNMFFPLLWTGMAMLLAANQAIRSAAIWAAPIRLMTLNGILVLLAVIAASIHASTLFLALVVWGIQFLSDDAPLQLRRAPLLGNLLDGMQLGAALLFGFVGFGAPMVGIPAKTLLLVIFGTALIAFSIEIKHQQPKIIPWLAEMPEKMRKPLQILVALAWFLLVFLISPTAELGVWLAACLPAGVFMALGYQAIAKWAALLPILVWFVGISP
jgi:hypothetical protein